MSAESRIPLVPSPPRRPSTLVRVGAVALVWLAALALTLSLAPYVARANFVFFWGAVLFAAWYAGTAVALVASIAAVVAVDWFLIPPAHMLTLTDPGEVLTLSIFVAVAMSVSTLVAGRARALRGLAASTRLLEEQTRELESQTEEAQALSEELEQSNVELGEALERADEERARATATLDNLQDVVTAFDAQWRFTYMNPAARSTLRALGVDPDAVMGRVVWEAMPQLEGTRFATETRRAAAERVTVEYEDRLPTLDRWYQTRVVPSADGSVTSYARDVTAQHRALAALQASETRYRALVEASTLMLWGADANGMVDDMPFWRELTGQTLEEVRGDGWTRAIHPDDRPHVLAAWQAAHAARSTYEAEYRLRLRDGTYRWYRARGVLVLGDDGQPREWIGVFNDTDDAHRDEDARAFLARASEALVSTLSVKEALAAVARIAVTPSGPTSEPFADGVAIDLPRPGGGFMRAALDSRDPAKSALVDRIEREYPTPEDAPAGYAHVIRTGEPELVEDFPRVVLPALARDARHLELLQALEMYSAIVVPLVARGETIGAITLVLTGPARRRGYDRRDLVVAEELARRAGIALDVALRYEAERVSADRAVRLLDVSAGLNEATTPEQVADVIFRDGMTAAGADAGSLALVRTDVDGHVELEIVRSAGFARTLVDRYRRFPLQPGRPLSDAILAREPRMVESLDAWRREYPTVATETGALGYEAMASVPVLSGGEVLGGLAFSFREPQRFDDATRTFLATLGEQCGLALARAHAFEAERRARAFSAEILASVRDGFVALDREFRYTFVNQQAEVLLRRSAAELLGRAVWEAFPDMRGSEFGRAFVRAMATQEVQTLEDHSPAANGWLEARVYPTPDGITVFFQDVTARRRAHEASEFLSEASRLLSASLDYEATLRSVAEAAVPRLADWCAVDILVDPTSTAWPPQLERLAVVHRDPAMIALGERLVARYPTDWSTDTGQAAVIRHGTPMFYPVVTDEMLVAGARDAEHLAMLRALHFSSIIVVPLVARGLTLGTLTLCATESRRQYTEAELALAQDLARRAAFAVDNARLFRDAERARAEAEAANQAKSQFLSTMSHELRTPLNAVLGYTELLDTGLRGPVSEAQRDDLGRIRRSAKVLMALVNDVLNFARVEAGQVDFHVEDVRLDVVLADLEALVTPQVRAKGLSYGHDSCGDSLVVRADPERLKQILTNLLTNAVKFTGEGGRISVTCDEQRGPDGARVRLRVCDTGRGIPPEQMARIFEPFVQIDRHLTHESQQGVGLGLAISRDLARRMGGDLTVESAPAHGSTFTLTLPAGGAPASGG